MNYRHTYHAGNFADVLKHVTLIALLQALSRKDAAFCYLETHAGIGRYDLLTDTTQKMREFEGGIKKILTQPNPPKLIQDYLTCVTQLNEKNTLRYYPGSPYIAKLLMRPQDRLVLSELHEEDYAILKKTLGHHKQIGIHHRDGYESLKAFLPPAERRGLVLIDPPYEKPAELLALPALVAKTLKQWETGVYALWYPIKTRRQIEHFYREFKIKVPHPTLVVELSIHAEDIPTQLNGSGMLIVNPPWQLDLQLKEALPWLWQAMSVARQGGASMYNL